MTFKELEINGVLEITQEPTLDNRGAFARIFCEEEFSKAGLTIKWNQVNQSYTRAKGAFRGIHYQFGPYSEYKLVKCISGAVRDYGVDLRKNSPTLFKSIDVELSASNNKMLLLPPGIGHAFQTLEESTMLLYLHSSFYKQEYEGGVRHNDDKIKLYLPLPISEISERDKSHPLLNDNFIGIEYDM